VSALGTVNVPFSGMAVTKERLTFWGRMALTASHVQSSAARTAAPLLRSVGRRRNLRLMAGIVLSFAGFLEKGYSEENRLYIMGSHGLRKPHTTWMIFAAPVIAGHDLLPW
jgi:hypothetical protein